MDDFHRMVAEFMNEWGFDATYLKQFSDAPNDDDGTISSFVGEIPVRAIKMDVFGNTAGNRTKIGALIQEADQVLYIQPTEKTRVFSEPLYVDPTSDRVRINGVSWKVVAIKEYDPSASDCVLYEMYIKR